MYASQVTQDTDRRHILPMKRQHTRRLLRQDRGALWRRKEVVEVLVWAIVGGCDLREETGDHLDDVRDGHVADFIPDGDGVGGGVAADAGASSTATATATATAADVAAADASP